MPYVASSISFNTLLFVGYLKALPAEIDGPPSSTAVRYGI